MTHDLWATDWVAALPPFHAFDISVAASREVESGVIVSDDKREVQVRLGEVADLFRALSDTSSKNPIAIGVKRLNTVYQRATEDDAILDVTIGLEALLTFDAKDEITHRLKTYLAALTTLYPLDGYTTADIFASVKHVYDFRSRVDE